MPGRAFAAITAAAIGATVAWPAYGAWLVREDAAEAPISLAAPAGAGGWQPVEPFTDWRPRYVGADASLFQAYEKDGQQVALYLGFYRRQRQDAELVNSQNVMVVQKHPVWQNVGEGARSIALAGGEVGVKRTLLRSPVQRLIAWDWLYIDGRHLSNPYLAKVVLARDKLLQRGDEGVAMVVSAPYVQRAEEAEAVLARFVSDMQPAIEASVSAAERSALAKTGSARSAVTAAGKGG